MVVVGRIQDKLVKRFKKQLSPSAKRPVVVGLRKIPGLNWHRKKNLYQVTGILLNFYYDVVKTQIITILQQHL